MGDLKIVFHVDRADQWPAMLSNLETINHDYPSVGVRVVVNGHAIFALLGTNDLTRALAQIADAGVQFQICADSLSEYRIDRRSLPNFAKVVPSGIIAVAKAQSEGFAYIKP